jgi:hypothetical protein
MDLSTSARGRLHVHADFDRQTLGEALATFGHLARVSNNVASQIANANGADAISDIEGKVARVATSKRGKRASFNHGNMP